MPLKPKESLNKAYRRQKVNRAEIESFRSNLSLLLKDLNEDESEEHLKNNVMAFLSDTWYKNDYFINTKGRTDFVIHQEKSPKSKVGVLTEVKRPGNKPEMISKEQLNAKALQELLLYYLREHKNDKDADIKYLVVTNIYEWFIFDAAQFYKYFYKNKKLQKAFHEWDSKQLEGTDTTFFYTKIASTYIAEVEDQLEYTWFDLREYEKELKKGEDSKKLISLFKVLSPVHLLKKPFANDSNSLNKQFYHELLHIIGLEEVKDKGKKVIQRKAEGKRIEGSFLENAIITMDERDRLRGLNRPLHFGNTVEEQLYAVALELCITWINRILFLKLMESQLVTYHKGDQVYRFLDIKTVPNYDALESLFFGVLAKRMEDRSDRYKEKYSKVPYLNSSLFEPTGLEEVMTVTMLNNNLEHELYSRTVLKDANGKPLSGKMDSLEYLFRFLEAYDFSSEGKEEIQEENKSLINASVLGLIFEKINGYKDGSFYTPGFITMYMCRETIRRAVVQKFNEAKGWKLETFDQLYDKIDDKKEANEIINSLKICDPAVGSGHFLVSALNEIIAIKSELKILLDREGKTLRDYEVTIENDELIVESEGDPFQYAIGNKEKQRVQETLFHEKQTIIENCLFGVDINANSVKICRLRLWIELLKNAYYKNEEELETLPNIDINIKTGNSLISRFDLDVDISDALKKSKWDVGTYRDAVNNYKNSTSKEDKRQFEKLIDSIKGDFETEINKKDKRLIKRSKLQGELFNLTNQQSMFEMGAKEKKKWEKEVATKTTALNKLENEIEEIKSNKIYEDAFEWRFEFPEVLDDQGNFMGFDVVIGNPPYFALSKSRDQQKYFEQNGFNTYSKGADIYCIFYERGIGILKENGFLTYITSNSWLRAIYGDNLKNYLVKNAAPERLLNIEDIQVFEEATVESNIITLRRSNTTESFPVVNLGDDYSLGDSLGDYFSKHHFTFNIPNTSEWFIGQPEIASLKQKLESDSKLLKEFEVRINFGIKTGYNDAFIIDKFKRQELIKKDARNDEAIKPIIRGRDLKKYSYSFNELWIIKSLYKGHDNFKKNYPALSDHLNKFKKRLESRGQVTNGQHHWMELDNNPTQSYFDLFLLPKIVWGEISDKPKFAFDDKQHHAEATTFFMTGERLKFFLAILNSKLSEWYFHLIGTTTGMGTNRWKKYKIELLPIKEPTAKQEKKVEGLVNDIIQIKDGDPSADTTKLEKQIDQLVYELYGLTDEEIDIIEQSVNDK